MSPNHGKALFSLLLCQICTIYAADILETINSTGFFYEPLGTAQISSDYASSDFYIGLNHFRTRFKLAENQTELTRGICDVVDRLYCKNVVKRNDSEPCRSALTYNCNQLLLFIKADLDKIKAIMGNFKTVSEKRTKRFLFEGGGHFLNFAFGTPAPGDADRYEASIRALKEHAAQQKNQIQALQQYTEKYAELVKKSISYLQTKSEKQLEININKVKDFMNSTMENQKTLESAVQVNAYLSTLSYLVNDLLLESQSFMNMIMFAKKQIPNKWKLSTDTFLKELKKFELSKDQFFPVTVSEENEKVLWSISSFRVWNIQDFIVVTVRTPLVHKGVYNISKVHSLPSVDAEGKVKTVTQVNQFYLHDGNETLIIDSLDLCEPFNGSNRICSMNNKIRGNSSLCEVALLKGDTSKCDPEPIEGSMFAILALQSNQWVVVSSESYEYRVTWKNQSLTKGEMSPGTYKITLSEGMSFNINSEELHWTGISTTTVDYYIPEAKPAVLHAYVGLSKERNLRVFHLEPIPKSLYNLNAWDELTESIGENKVQWDQAVNINKLESPSWKNTISAILFGLIVLLVCFLGWQCYGEKCRNRKMQEEPVSDENIMPMIVKPVAIECEDKH